MPVWLLSTRQSNETTRHGRITKQGRTITDSGNQSSSLDGQPDECTADEFLHSEEERKGIGQSNLCNSQKTADNRFRDVEKGIGLLVFGRSLVQSEAAVAQCSLRFDFA